MRRLAVLALSSLLSCTAADSDTLRLYVFDCGSIDNDSVTDYGLKDTDTDVRELFVPCYLIQHGREHLLWDSGLPLTSVGRGTIEIEPGMRIRYDVSLIDQLAAMGLTPDDIDYVAFSHFHFDHIGAANAFANSHLLIPAAEHEAAFEHADEYPVYESSLYEALGDAETTLLEGDYDVFGDGRVLLLSAPGHTPGHQVLFLELANTGPLVLSGDLYHFEKSRELGAVPVFNTDADATRASFRRIESFLAEHGATLWIGHSKALADSLDKAPAYYD